MKLAASLALWTASASAGRVFICDGLPPSTSAEQTLSPSEARLVLAQRAGVLDYHTADLNSRGSVEAINEFGRRTELFGGKESMAESMTLVDGEVDVDILSQQCRSFAVSPSPDFVASQGLWIDMVRQSLAALPSESDTAILARIQEGVYATHRSPNTDDHGEDKIFMIRTPSALEQIFKTKVLGRTIYVPSISSPGEGQGEAQWGTYTLPPSHQVPNHLHLSKRAERERPQPETPLELAPTTSLTTEDLDFLASASNSSSNSTSKPLRGILPACFTTKSSCESSTRSCMGHGTCTLSFTDQSAAKDSKSQHCYACACSPTIVKNEDGTVKTTYWGGPACQKKDISIEFWMLALFSVAMVFLIMFAVGTLMEMGGEELPSVIGAGVSGPTAKR
ncbi:hypothetical protein LTR10_009206 [Elasticomyces elasticus]|nr:hypothetical protein LTR10_009206 [Elasticomyces elasticus]KAK4971693.1 hypothetical protein LTR42_007421 [Elasticomyces elasticus]